MAPDATSSTRSPDAARAVNHEFSPGQFEINLGHSGLVDAADRSFRLKSAVQEIARQRDLLATFMAKPFNDEGGSGFHVHVSVNDEAWTTAARWCGCRRSAVPPPGWRSGWATPPPTPTGHGRRRRGRLPGHRGQDRAGDKLEGYGYGYDPVRAQILPLRLGDALDALAADCELADVLGGYFVSSFLAYKRNEIERFEHYVTDWEFREYAYHLL
jgi:glutamine synthetase